MSRDAAPNRYDAILIGTGQAAPALANRMNREGLRVAVIERHKIGGTCVNVGCIPTKALVASARAAHVARRGPEFGVLPDEPVRIDMKRVNARMKPISGRSNENVTAWLDGTAARARRHDRARGSSASRATRPSTRCWR